MNADVSFDQPDWGTRATLAYFAISDVLDAAGVATPNNSGRITSFTLDQYVASYGQLDLIVSQKLWRGLSIKFTAKNLTDDKQGIVYDPEQTDEKVYERRFRVGPGLLDRAQVRVLARECAPRAVRLVPAGSFDHQARDTVLSPHLSPHLFSPTEASRAVAVESTRT